MINLFNMSHKKSNTTFFKVDEYIHLVHLNLSAYPELNKQLQLLDLTKKI